MQRAGATLRCDARASHCGGFSRCGAWALGSRTSVVVAWGLSSCGARAYLLRGTWDLPGARTRVLCIGSQILNHYATREVPSLLLDLDTYSIRKSRW